ncbi:MAG: hypothetical protein AAGA85_27615 [Bacteroidota bacterium]
MNCLIDQAIDENLRRGQTVEAIRAYIEDRYRVKIDLSLIRRRIKGLKLPMPV